ncbi:MAG: LPD29 domain-containing protein, partial [Cyanobacteria bacterium J06641_5]
MIEQISTKDTAKIIRQVLKENFPGIKFSVRCSQASMCSGISIRYEDGPAWKAVEALVERFRGNTFDGMQDMKMPCEPDTWEGKKVRWGCTFAPSVERRVSIQLASRIETYIRQYWVAATLATFKLVIDEERGSWYVNGKHEETQIFYTKLHETNADDPLNDAEGDRQRHQEQEDRELREYEEGKVREAAATKQQAAEEAKRLAAIRALLTGVECREVEPYFVTAQFSGYDKLQTLAEFREELTKTISRRGAEACTKRVRICHELEMSLEQFRGFSSALWDEWEFLDGKGGSTATSPLPPMDRRGNRDPKALARWRAGVYRDNSILLRCRTGQLIVINPEGYSWAHEVGLNVRSENGKVTSILMAPNAKNATPQAKPTEAADPTPSLSLLKESYRQWIDGLIAAGNFDDIRSFDDWQQPYSKSVYEAWVMDLHQRETSRW